MATTSKQRLLQAVLSGQDKARPSEEDDRPVLEQFLYALCLEGTSFTQADRAWQSLKTSFFDWNEVRVSSEREVADALCGLPEAEQRAQRIISFLQEVFEKEFCFDLEVLHKRQGGVKQAAKALATYEAANDHVVSWVVQHSLGGHAIPLDTLTFRTAQRLGLIDGSQQDRSAAQSSLEHLIPKAKGTQFTVQINYITHQHCLEEEPSCPGCPMASDCPTGQERAGAVATTTKAR